MVRMERLLICLTGTGADAIKMVHISPGSILRRLEQVGRDPALVSYL